MMTFSLNRLACPGNLHGMKSAVLFLLGLLLLTGPARADIINGRGYVSLAVWARANGLGAFSLNSGTEYVLTNRNSRLIFNQDSADSTINGVNVRLSFPIAKGGLVSQSDADKTLRPLVFAQRPSARKVRTICLDPGHGGRDTGNRVGRFFPRCEKTYTLALALELRRQLQLAGFNVILTRDKDVYPELPTRPDLANRRGADLFISLHFNSTPTDAGDVRGPETYCITPVGAASSNDAEREGLGAGPCAANRFEDKSLLLAFQVQRSLVNRLNANDRGVRRARFEVLRIAQMPAILIEGGYMSHPAEGRKIFDAGWRQRMAAAIVRGIVNYQKLTDPPTVAPAASTNKVPQAPGRR
jgi:N-acetylmuramoyl-L-alanine amidase